MLFFFTLSLPQSYNRPQRAKCHESEKVSKPRKISANQCDVILLLETSKRGSTNDRKKISQKVRESRKKKTKAAKKSVEWKSSKIAVQRAILTTC